MREINRIIVHCSATPPSMDIGVEEITDWHVNGNGWSDIGYHWVIRRDGLIEEGRPVYKEGAHASGHNDDSIGICLVGGVDESGEIEDNFTGVQYAALEDLTFKCINEYGTDDPIGHCDLPDVTKACPCFDVGEWWESVASPIPTQDDAEIGEEKWFRIAFGGEVYEGNLTRTS